MEINLAAFFCSPFSSALLCCSFCFCLILYFLFDYIFAICNCFSFYLGQFFSHVFFFVLQFSFPVLSSLSFILCSFSFATLATSPTLPVKTTVVKLWSQTVFTLQLPVVVKKKSCCCLFYAIPRSFVTLTVGAKINIAKIDINLRLMVRYRTQTPANWVRSQDLC